MKAGCFVHRGSDRISFYRDRSCTILEGVLWDSPTLYQALYIGKRIIGTPWHNPIIIIEWI